MKKKTTDTTEANEIIRLTNLIVDARQKAALQTSKLCELQDAVEEYINSDTMDIAILIRAHERSKR